MVMAVIYRLGYIADYDGDKQSSSARGMEQTKNEHQAAPRVRSNQANQVVQPLGIKRRTISRPAAVKSIYMLLFVLIFGIVLGMMIDGMTASASSAHSIVITDDIQANIHSESADSLLGAAHASQLDHSSYKSIDVMSGDTLWSIAREHKPDHMHIREYIERIKSLNGLSNSMLYEGMLLRLP